MITPQLLSYIKIQLQKNISAEEIKKILLANGWQIADVEEAFSKAVAPISEAVIKPAPVIEPVKFAEPVFAHSTPAQTKIVATAEPQKGSNKFLIGLTLVAIVLLLGAGGAFAYFFYSTPPALTPDEIVLKSLSKLSEINSLEYSGDIKISFNPAQALAAGQSLRSAQATSSTSSSTLISLTGTSSEKMSEVVASFSGASDLQTIVDPRSSFTLNISTAPFGPEVASTTGENFNFGLESRSLGKVFYVKLNEAPNLGFFDLTPFKGQWIKIDFDSIKKQAGLVPQPDASTTLAIENATSTISVEQIEQIKAVFYKYKIIKVASALPEEKIGETDTYHYNLTIDKAELKLMIIDIANIVQKEGLSAEDLQKFDQGLAAAEIPNFEVWIGKKDFFPYKLIIDSDVKGSDNNNIGKVTFTVNLKNFNQPISVVAPDSSKSIEEVVMDVYKAFASTTPVALPLKK